MKKVIVIVNVLVGLILMGCQGQSNSSTMKQDNVIENIRTRVSVRQFTGEKISEEQIQTLLQCAMSAPSAINRQPWAFIVVTEDSVLAQLGQAFPYSRCDQHPAIAIVPCGDMSKAIEDEGRDFWIDDVSAATQNILLAAHSMGLGAVWTGLYPTERYMQAQTLLGLPEHIIPLCIVPVGVPAEQPEIKDKWNTSNIHYNRW